MCDCRCEVHLNSQAQGLQNPKWPSAGRLRYCIKTRITHNQRHSPVDRTCATLDVALPPKGDRRVARRAGTCTCKVFDGHVSVRALGKGRPQSGTTGNPVLEDRVWQGIVTNKREHKHIAKLQKVGSQSTLSKLALQCPFRDLFRQVLRQ